MCREVKETVAACSPRYACYCWTVSVESFQFVVRCLIADIWMVFPLCVSSFIFYYAIYFSLFAIVQPLCVLYFFQRAPWLAPCNSFPSAVFFTRSFWMQYAFVLSTIVICPISNGFGIEFRLTDSNGFSIFCRICPIDTGTCNVHIFPMRTECFNEKKNCCRDTQQKGHIVNGILVANE